MLKGADQPFRELQYDKEEWVTWATTHWKLILNYVPTISLLANRWMVIVFIEDAEVDLAIQLLLTSHTSGILSVSEAAQLSQLKA